MNSEKKCRQLADHIRKILGRGITLQGEDLDLERIEAEMRKIIAEHMIDSRRTSAHVHTIYEIDCSNIVNTRKKVQGEFQRRHGQKLTITPFIVKGCVEALHAVLEAGGLHIVGTERHESRRVDNQLRGRSGRQGDPGSTRFYLSLEDNLMRIFASDRVSALMQKLGMQEGEAIEHPWVTKAIENAQRKVEQHNFNIRKTLLEFDDVANDQRKVVYEERNELMETDDVSETIRTIRHDVVNDVINGFIPPGSMDEQWDVADGPERDQLPELRDQLFDHQQ